MLTRPAILLRIEEAALLILSLFAYQHLRASWLLFAILFLTPDLFMLGYTINPKIGAATYNLVHTLFQTHQNSVILSEAQHFQTHQNSVILSEAQRSRRACPELAEGTCIFRFPTAAARVIHPQT